MNISATGLFRLTGIEFPMTRAEFDRIRELVRDHSGIALGDTKQQLVQGRLARRLRALKLANYAEYIDMLERGERGELEEFVNAITTNLTAFFRESHHFDYLANELLPLRVAQGAGRLRIWCCAASSGEEPYSIAMVLREAAAALAGRDVKVLATDLDSAALASGVAGIYPHERVQDLSPARRSRFFKEGSGALAGQVRVREELRSLITFKQLNLMNEWPMRGPFDAIFCRNVIIYFDKPTQKVLFERFAALQRPGDFLFLGHSESLYRVSNRYELIGRTIYRRLDN